MAKSYAVAAIYRWAVIALACVAVDQGAGAQAPTGDAAAQKAIEARITAATQLGPQQKALAGYLGRWNVDIELPGQAAHSAATAEYSWVIEGRWLGCRIKGSMLGQPFEEFTILGYDNYAKNVVEVSVESADNSMLMARGTADGSTQSTQMLYGELDEYIRGSLHRPYKVVLHWLNAQHHVTEVWDLGPGEHPVEKVKFTFSR